MAKSREWLDKVDEFVSDLAGEIDAVKASEAYRKHLDVMSTFWHYSFSNQMLLALQYPEATMVAGFRQWKKKGRWVRKGERAIHILAPGIKKVEDGEGDEDRIIQYFFTV
ncbi:ArdC family protein, partial [Patescibacteria group bacterium]|nr:ArdC family protein [Patescibacteria group bacterium]